MYTTGYVGLVRNVGICGLECNNFTCIYICKSNALDKMEIDDYIIITLNETKCILCYLCECICPIESIKIDERGCV